MTNPAAGQVSVSPPGKWPARLWPASFIVTLTVGVVVLLYGLLGMLVAFLFVTPASSASDPVAANTSITELETAVAAGVVREVSIAPAGADPTSSTVTLNPRENRNRTVSVPTSYTPILIEKLLTKNIDVQNVPRALADPPAGSAGFFPPQSPGIFITVGLVLLALAIPLRMQSKMALARYKRQVQAAEKAATKTPGEADEVDIPATRFTDVAGAPEAVAEMTELVELLANPARFAAVGAQAPRGALLVGPPGTGKTLLARAVAGEAGVPFYAAAGSDFVELYVGVGSKRVRELFDKARQHEKALIFIDEIDAIGKARGSTVSNADSERDSTLIALLTELDGFHERNVIIIAATNRGDLLDPALTRPGRLDKQIHVPLPDRVGRAHILHTHASSRPLAADVEVEQYARRTAGFSGADLAQLVNEAALCAARDYDTEITSTHFDTAVATIAIGVARTSAAVTDHDRRITAFHEAGHTVAGLAEKDADPPVHVSIIPRGVAGGVTWMGESDNHFLTRTAAWSRLVVAMAGREGEKLVLDGDWTSGASADLNAATKLATTMITQLGMEHTLSTHTAGPSAEVRSEIDKVLAAAAVRARIVLADQRELLDAVAAALLTDDDVDTAGLDGIVTRVSGGGRAALHAGVRDRLGTPAPAPGWLAPAGDSGPTLPV
jgi:cell division protease FtsH